MMKLFQDKPGPGMELLIFGLLIFLSFFVTLFLSMLLAMPLFGLGMEELQAVMGNATDESNLDVLRYLQIINQIGLFILPALLFGILLKRNFVYYFHFEREVAWKSLLAVFLLLFTILPLINFLAHLNSSINLPDSLAGLENWMKNQEQAAQQLTGKFLEVTDVKGFLVNFLMIAILPAIGEELFFRGALQQIFTRWFKNAHVAIIVTSVLFSALHLQFFGFFPRFLLGVIFGYLFYWSRSIWLPIFAHFVNNGAAVVVAFMAARGQIAVGMEDFGNYNGTTWIIIINSIFSALLIYYVYSTEVRGIRSE